MFFEPVQRVKPFETLEALAEYAIRLPASSFTQPQPKQYFALDDLRTVFCYSEGSVFVTPNWSELLDLFAKDNYQRINLAPEDPVRCQIEELLAEQTSKWDFLFQYYTETCWSEAFEACHKLSQSRKIYDTRFVEPVEVIDVTYGVYREEVKSKEDPMSNHSVSYRGMITVTPKFSGFENVCSYIYYKHDRLLICDEYGRTFLILPGKIACGSLNSIVNRLISAGYHWTREPEKYITITKS